VYPAPKPLAEQLREALRVSIARSVAAALPWNETFEHFETWVDAVSAPGLVLAQPLWVEIQ
jgi:hypothetical protein